MKRGKYKKCFINPPSATECFTQRLYKRQIAIMCCGEMCPKFCSIRNEGCCGQILPVEPQWEYNPWEPLQS